MRTILVGNVLNDAVTPVHTEIDIEIRHRNPLRIQETFEQQVIRKWIKIGNQQCVSHQRPCPGTATRPHRNLVVTRPLDEVSNNQKVTGETHLRDNIKFTLEPIVIGLSNVGEIFRVSVV